MRSDNGTRYELEGALTEIVRHIYGIRMKEDADTVVYHLSPSLEMVLVFNFGPALSFSFGEEEIAEQQVERIGIIGPMRKMLNYELKPGTDLLTLPFVNDGFFRFMKLSTNNVDLSDEDSVAEYADNLNTLWEEMNALPATELRVELLKEYLAKAAKEGEDAVQPLLENASAFFDPVLSPSKVIAEKAAITERAVQMRFKKYVGYSPKELLRYLRFKQVVAYLMAERGKPVDWFDLIVQFGYHDQSHLIRDFKFYTGGTPTQFLEINDSGDFCTSRD
ncbi:helix-turn-helix domain-containing protein [Pseudobacter ginsenosidimutans]|uniref:Helix-turn-helix protein n=1 Tax=Pseudobacter ginsenosidimutans TaxID=661488 RepID=A0A4Q7MW49_9BACT|nr:helix-turn-helix domain-containing protein [Pseudobacter ginsenosidimutans]QEC40986.1 AraC family transcriptional regulator [Pseudobacter ginsenosidimutans]RZS72269.1 helix-turn-helix protein [Pseudobacter ginsenosidimutans]